MVGRGGKLQCGQERAARAGLPPALPPCPPAGCSTLCCPADLPAGGWRRVPRSGGRAGGERPRSRLCGAGRAVGKGCKMEAAPAHGRPTSRRDQTALSAALQRGLNALVYMELISRFQTCFQAGLALFSCERRPAPRRRQGLL